MAYTVKSPLVVAKTDGGYVHVYEGGLLPEDIDSDQLEQLIAQEMVADNGEKPKRSRAAADTAE